MKKILLVISLVLVSSFIVGCADVSGPDFTKQPINKPLDELK